MARWGQFATFAQCAASAQRGIDLDQSASVVASQARRLPGLIWINSGVARSLNQLLMTASRPRPPAIRHCPLCGVAMQASKSHESLAEFDTFRCQTCQTTIMEKPLSPRNGG